MAWFTFFIIAKILKFERFGFTVNPLFMLMRSKGLNPVLERLGRWNPKFWRIIGNIGVLAGILCRAGSRQPLVYAPLPLRAD